MKNKKYAIFFFAGRGGEGEGAGGEGEGAGRQIMCITMFKWRNANQNGFKTKRRAFCPLS